MKTNKIINSNIRNLAIVAHVDHGKTTLVDSLLKQSDIFRAGQNVGELIMDTNPLERERGITILSKNASVTYKGVKINIIDTPGHADFSGEVERIMNMADGCLLLVDAVDGPMPQTRYVLNQALQQNVAPLVVINKIDRPEARVDEVIEMVHDLFLDLATNSDQLDFPVLMTSAKGGYAKQHHDSPDKDMKPLLDMILNTVPAPVGDPDSTLQILVAALDYDTHLGQIAIGRIFRGKIRAKDTVSLLSKDGSMHSHNVEKVFVFTGLDRNEVSEAKAGEIVAIAGVGNVYIGDTISDTDHPEALPPIHIDDPTVKMTFGINTSPFMGLEGTNCTSRVLYQRLLRELRTNVSLRVDKTSSPDEFLVSGRGELQLAILVETLRREEYEFQVSKPEPITKIIDGNIHEPYELLTIDIPENHLGALTDNLSGRLGQLVNLTNNGSGNVRLEYSIPTRGLIGFGSFFMRATRGSGTKDNIFTEYRPMEGQLRNDNNRVLVASDTGTAVTYGLINAQGRGDTFIDPGTSVYEGMIVGIHRAGKDIPVNVCKEKKLTNMRSSNSDIAQRLSPSVKLSLEEALDMLSEDELLEATPKNFRIRKKELSTTIRQRKEKNDHNGKQSS